jgi:hypothetical protein
MALQSIQRPIVGLSMLILLVAGTTLSPARASAFDSELRAGVFMDADAFALGGGFLAPVGNRWFFNPNAEFAFGDQDLVAVSGDFHYDFAGSNGMSPWLGLGPTILMRDTPGDGSDTDVGLNVLAGLGGTRGTLRPFAQVRGIVADNSQVVLTGGIRF